MITLNHFLRGPLRVVPIDMLHCREWLCLDRPMLRPMADGEFTETRAQIEEMLREAKPEVSDDLLRLQSF